MKLVRLANNFHTIKFGDLRVWFSYETPIAFKRDGQNTIISENIWGRTTGKHINQVKKEHDYLQVPNEEFLSQL